VVLPAGQEVVTAGGDPYNESIVTKSVPLGEPFDPPTGGPHKRVDGKRREHLLPAFSVFRGPPRSLRRFLLGRDR